MSHRYSRLPQLNRLSGKAARCLRRHFFFIWLLVAAPVVAGPMLDQNGNTMSDVWEQIYGAGSLPAGTDTDGDGFSNASEALAGTNPSNASSFPKITKPGMAAAAFSVTIPVELGKLYQLQSVTNLGSTNWLVETNYIVRSGTNLTFSVAVASAGKYFRTAVSDVDSDGDSLSDWEEYKLGLNPFNATSNGQIDNNGDLLNDRPYATNRFASQNIFTIQATDPVTMEPDSGYAATDFGTLTVTRGGFPLKSVTVNFTLATGTGFATEGVDHTFMARSVAFPVSSSSQTIFVTPLANTNLQVPVIAQARLSGSANYLVGSASNASVVIYPSVTAKGSGLTGYYFTNASTTYSNTNNFNTNNLFLTRIDPVIDFTWTNGTSPNLSNGLYTVRWVGQVQPQYSELYYFDVFSDDGCVLWINDKVVISNWVSKAASSSVGTIALQAGTRYNLKLEYLQNGGSGRCQLNWYSDNQSKQVIPASRLYPTNSTVAGGGTNGPATITSALVAYGFIGQPFSNTVTAANSPLRFTATNLPPGLAFNPTNGLISGVPTLAGKWQVPLTASNSAGIGASVVDITIFDTGSAVSREIWTNIPGVNIADIPLATPGHITGALSALEGTTNYGDNYGERIRGYFTAPATANYYFWIAGSDSVQLLIADDSEAVTKLLRCWVTPTNNPTVSGQNGTSPRQWNLQSNQRSGWLSLSAGQKYFIEVLHKAGIGTNDHWAVGWLQDPAGTNTTPAGVTPSYLLSRYFTPPPTVVAGTLYTANLVVLPGATSSAGGSATLRVSADGSQAVLNYSLNGISGAHVDHIYSDPYLVNPTTLVFDIAAANPQPDGSYIWPIVASGSLSAADVLETLVEGKCSIVIQTPAYPDGEIGGHFKLANGAQTFTAPPAPPAWADDSATTNGAVRFLTQATYGASPADIASVQSLGYANWINAQIALPMTPHFSLVQSNRSADPSNIYPSSGWFNAWWQNAVTAPDQLRQRVAFALSEILVVSESGTLQDHADALAYYFDLLLTNAFGNFRNLLEDVSLSPAMGVYLNMQGNTKGSIINGTHPNENYAREINQLFSIGLNRLWPDGSLMLNSAGNLIPTYNQNVINGFSAVFTGWNYFQTNAIPTSFSPAVNWSNQMSLVPGQHELGAKLLLNNVVLPPGWGAQTNTTTTNCYSYCQQDFELAHDSIFNHPNVGPFLCRQLIQRLVTSHPSDDYLYRVVQKFNDNGNGVRGDMAAVVKAILLDYEARSSDLLTVPTYGKQREPLLRVTAMARAFPAPAAQTGTYSQTGTQTNSITLPQPHRMNNGDTVAMSFIDGSGNPAPPNQNYPITVINSNTFSIVMPNLLTGTYGQTNGIITVNISGHGLAVDDFCYLVFTSGSAITKKYSVLSVVNGNRFTMATTNMTQTSGNCVMPKVQTAGYVQSGNVATVSCAAAHGLVANELIYIPANSVFIPANYYTVNTVPDATHFTILAPANNTTQSGFSLYPLGSPPPPLTRSGTATTTWSTWNMGYTDTSSTYNLSQSPLSANTVFNFFFPDYTFPGALSAAGLTTPEFQLTSDTSVALQMNFLAAGLLNTANTNNINGLSSFSSTGNGNGAIVMDIGPWMTTNLTSAAGVPLLVDNLNSILLAGQLSAAAKSNIVNYVTNTVNFPFSAPPTQTQIRDRVRAVVHLITCSPDYTIQR